MLWSSFFSASRASLADFPSPSSSTPLVPSVTLTAAWVATAPAPALAYGTTAPTARYLDATATPHSFRSGSYATMEKVAA
jgi:hypothetical protein